MRTLVDYGVIAFAGGIQMYAIRGDLEKIKRLVENNKDFHQYIYKNWSDGMSTKISRETLLNS